MIQKLILSQTIMDIIQNIAIGGLGVLIASCHIAYRQNHGHPTSVMTYILLIITGCLLLYGLLSAGYGLLLLVD